MSRDKEQHPSGFSAMRERGPGIFVLILLVIGTLVVGGAWYLDSRLDKIEDRLGNRRPASFQPPDLTQFPMVDGETELTGHPFAFYVPAWSHVYAQGGSPLLLETTLSIRNTSPERALLVNSVVYFDSRGKPVRTLLDEAIRLGPLQTIEFLVESRDVSGGSGANFVVSGSSASRTPPALADTVMVGIHGTHGLGFRCPGVLIKPREP